MPLFYRNLRLPRKDLKDIMRLRMITWALRLLSAAIMLQTLYFKFTAHPESVQLFSQLRAEPWGRIGVGIIELITSIMILIPRTSTLGSFAAAVIMTGAIAAHIFVLGVYYGGDAILFTYAMVVFLASLTLLYIDRRSIRSHLKRTFGNGGGSGVSRT